MYVNIEQLLHSVLLFLLRGPALCITLDFSLRSPMDFIELEVCLTVMVHDAAAQCPHRRPHQMDHSRDVVLQATLHPFLTVVSHVHLLQLSATQAMLRCFIRIIAMNTVHSFLSWFSGQQMWV